MVPAGLLLHVAAIIGGFGSSGEKQGDGVHATRCREEGEAKHLRVAVDGKVQYCNGGFQMPLHYPRFKREDYEQMEGWKLDALLREYGLSFHGPLHAKRAYAMGAFLWPDQL